MMRGSAEVFKESVAGCANAVQNPERRDAPDRGVNVAKLPKLLKYAK
jgi:hypothetical protein